MNIYIMDFGIVLYNDSSKNYKLIKYYENKKLFNMVNNIDNNIKLIALDNKKFNIDRGSFKRMKYWLNKFKNLKNITPIKIITDPYEIECLLNNLPTKYIKTICTIGQ